MTIAIIGAGIIGAALARELAERGAAVLLIDQDEPGRATTKSSFAWCNANEKWPADYHRLNRAGMRAWAALSSTLDGAAWHRPVGNLEWGDPGQLRAKLGWLTSWGYPASVIDRAQAAELEPNLRVPDEVGELCWFPEEGYVLTEPLVDRLVARAVELGATLVRGRVVARDERGVSTADGRHFAADTVVSCAGRWTPEVTAVLGHEVPVLPWAEPGVESPGFVVLVGTPGPNRILHTPEVDLRPAPGGLHLECRGIRVDLHTPEPELRAHAEQLLARARRIVPALAEATVTGYRVCVRPIPVDRHPVVGALPGNDYVVVTHSGVTLAAHLANLAATELLDGVELPELAPYRLARLAEATSG